MQCVRVFENSVVCYLLSYASFLRSACFEDPLLTHFVTVHPKIIILTLVL